MAGKANINGSWKDVSTMHTKIGDTWKEVTDGYVFDGNNWQVVYNSVVPSGYAIFVTSDTWVAPPKVRSVSAVVIGAGGGGADAEGAGGAGGAGGALSWKNNISVTPGQSYSIVVGQGGQGMKSKGRAGDGGDSSAFGITSGGGQGGSTTSGASGGIYDSSNADGGGNGGNVPSHTSTGDSTGGGGAGGYTGNGGDGASINGPGNAGSGGGGGGGGAGGSRDHSGAGGGVRPYGAGDSGAAGLYTGDDGGPGGGGSSGGQSPSTTGGKFGGGGGGADGSNEFGDGAGGIVLVTWGEEVSLPTNSGISATFQYNSDIPQVMLDFEGWGTQYPLDMWYFPAGINNYGVYPHFSHSDYYSRPGSTGYQALLVETPYDRYRFELYSSPPPGVGPNLTMSVSFWILGPDGDGVDFEADVNGSLLALELEHDWYRVTITSLHDPIAGFDVISFELDDWGLIAIDDVEITYYDDSFDAQNSSSSG